MHDAPLATQLRRASPAGKKSLPTYLSRLPLKWFKAQTLG
jgi:hypothetical protein